MEIDRPRVLRMVSSAAVTALLAAMCAGLAAMLVVSIRGARQASGPGVEYYSHMAWLSLALLAMSVLLLVWRIAHHVAVRLFRRTPRKPTQYVDAWTLAGRRFKLDDEADTDETGRWKGG